MIRYRTQLIHVNAEQLPTGDWLIQTDSGLTYTLGDPEFRATFKPGWSRYMYDIEYTPWPKAAV